MRVNHCGEICAQALYQGQALASRDPVVRRELEQAAWEETEHLNWTENAHRRTRRPQKPAQPACGTPARWPSARSPANAAIPGAWAFWPRPNARSKATSPSHMARLPAQDSQVLGSAGTDETLDEIRHAETAVDHGARELPRPVKLAMKLSSKVMTRLSYWI
jgi:ubiquinone biosynthesis monooxygenase Coq7